MLRVRRWIARHFEVPSGPPSLPRLHKVRLLALLAVRNQLSYLPGWFKSVSAQVDGVIALDDGSTDGSAEFLQSCAEVLELISRPVDRPYWDEMGNHRRLVEAALRHCGEWLISLDADERLERDFRHRCERVIARGRMLGYTAYGIHVRDLWDADTQYRVDGIWSNKTSARLFKARRDHQFDKRALHGTKAPLQARIGNLYPIADLNLYHLGMLKPENRAARRQRYELLDPNNRWQRGLGYSYLTDITGLEVRDVPQRRGFLDETCPVAACSGA